MFGGTVRYVLVKNGLTDKGTMLPEDSYRTAINSNSDFYRSLFYYTQEQFDKFQSTGTMAGFKDLITDRLYFDLDYKEDLNVALKDCRTLVSSLIIEGIPSESVQVCFSGGKGFSIEVNTDESFTAETLRLLTTKIAGELTSFDTSIYNNNRIIREPFTKHQTTGLYKKPLQKKKLYSFTVDQIKQEAASLDVTWSDVAVSWQKKIKLPSKYIRLLTETPVIKKEEKPSFSVSSSDIDFSKKLAAWSNCKYSLLQGNFGFVQGERHEALTILAATCKSLNYDKNLTYHMCKSAIEKQAALSGREKFSTDELWLNIIEKSIYGDNWQGGAYTCRKPGWLQNYCQGLGEHACKHDEKDQDKPTKFSEIADSFKEYVKNIERNTIKTGIKSIDASAFISTGSNVGIIGSGGSGKSALALEILNNTSKAGVPSVFASLDMSRSRMYEKALYRISGLPREQLYALFKENKEKPLLEKMDQEFGNVHFYSKSCPTVKELRNYILKCQEESGQKIKLVVVDYIERISTDTLTIDDNLAVKRTASELQDIVNDLDVAMITLVQPNKSALQGGPDRPLYDYTAIKGSSYIQQSFRLIMSIWRPGFHPSEIENDKYMKLAILKNDLGELNEFVFRWFGKEGKIRELTPAEKTEFDRFMAAKEEERNNVVKGGSR